MNDKSTKPFRMRIDNTDDGLAGTVASGTISKSDEVKILPEAISSTVSRVAYQGKEVQSVEARQSVQIFLSGDTPIKKGAVICPRDNPVEVADQFEVILVWQNTEPLLSGRPYVFRFGKLSVPGSVTNIKYKVGEKKQHHLAATVLEKDERAIATISIQQSVAFTGFEENPILGSFNIVDLESDEKVGSGEIKFALRRASNIHLQSIDLDRNVHAAQKQQKPCVLWFTGLSGSGKSTIANALETQLNDEGHHTFLLDGDNVRHGLNRDLGFTDADRVENIRRIAEVARLMTDAGLIVITSFISPFVAERQMARELMSPEEFFEIYVDTPLEVCEKRDEKGLYAKARAGEIKNFTGIDSAYEPPITPEISVESAVNTPQQAASIIVEFLKEKNRLS